ncbi:MAG: urea carboxylase-associated family protein [Chloroflexota bacterium]
MAVRLFRNVGVDDPLAIDPAFYDRIGSGSGRSLANELVVAPRSGLAWPVLAGQVCRITTVDGPQAGDLNVWSLRNPRERFWAARSRQLEGSHVTTHSRLWSSRPYHRPMLTMVSDTLPSEPSELGGRCHDLTGTGCDPFIWQLMNGVSFDRTCYNNLSRAIAPYHMTEFDVHDVLNLFMRTGLQPGSGMYFMEPVPAKAGDFVEFFAEIDVLCALSSCPAGDISVPHLGPDHGDAQPTCHPLGVEVFDVDPQLLEGWRSPDPVDMPGIGRDGSPGA